MVASLGSKETDWNFRIFAQRNVQIKAKNADSRKIVATDLLTKTPITIKIPQEVPIEPIEIEKQYIVSLKIYTLKSIEGIDERYVEFFEILDVDQSIDDFIKIFWTYPNHIRFVLAEIESM